MDKLPQSRKEKAVITRNKIYSAAEQLFLERGFDSVNIDDIVKLAGVAKGSFYVHFQSKDILIATLISDYVGRLDGRYQGFLDSLPEEMPIEEVFLAVVGEIAHVLSKDIGCDIMKLIYKIQLGNDGNNQDMISYNRGLYKILYGVIKRGCETGVFRSDIPMEDIVKQIVVAYRGLTFEWCLRYPNFHLKERAMEHFRLFLKGILAG